MVVIFGLVLNPWILAGLFGVPAAAGAYVVYKRVRLKRAEVRSVKNASGFMQKKLLQEEAVEKSEKVNLARVQAEEKTTKSTLQKKAAEKQAAGEDTLETDVIKKLDKVEGKAEEKEVESQIVTSHAEEEITAATAAVEGAIKTISQEVQHTEQVQAVEANEDQHIAEVVKQIESVSSPTEMQGLARERLQLFIQSLLPYLKEELALEEREVGLRKESVEMMNSSIKDIKVLLSAANEALAKIKKIEGKEQRNLNQEVKASANVKKKIAAEIDKAKEQKTAPEELAALENRQKNIEKSHDDLKAMNAYLRKIDDMIKKIVQPLTFSCKEIIKLGRDESKDVTHVKNKQKEAGKALKLIKKGIDSLTRLPEEYKNFDALATHFSEEMKKYFEQRIHSVQMDLEIREADKNIIVDYIQATRYFSVIERHLRGLEKLEEDFEKGMESISFMISDILKNCGQDEAAGQIYGFAITLESDSVRYSEFKQKIGDDMSAEIKLLSQNEEALTKNIENLAERDRAKIAQLQVMHKEWQQALAKITETIAEDVKEKGNMSDSRVSNINQRVSAINENSKQKLKAA
ncbi:MAG TPA: hypothetical protein VJI15_02920 [Candidatus Nanoarchaeia archaeon]|nr:hypothetical protein [Candidatus Nanoarchaeia archaeon]